MPSLRTLFPSCPEQTHTHTHTRTLFTKCPKQMYLLSAQDCHAGRMPGLSKLRNKIRITDPLRLEKPLEIKSTKEVQGGPGDWVQ